MKINKEKIKKVMIEDGQVCCNLCGSFDFTWDFKGNCRAGISLDNDGSLTIEDDDDKDFEGYGIECNRCSNRFHEDLDGAVDEVEQILASIKPDPGKAAEEVVVDFNNAQNGSAYTEEMILKYLEAGLGIKSED